MMKYIILLFAVAAFALGISRAGAQFTYFYVDGTGVAPPPGTSCTANITGSGTATAILTGTATALANLTCQ